VLHILLSKFGNCNKFKNSREERIDFLLQNQWNNFSLKTCGCKSFFYCTNVRKKNLLRSIEDKQPSKKRTNPFGGSIFFFNWSKIPSKKKMCQKDFLEDLGLLIVKNNLPI
jgi:hypothetical protein